MKDQILFSLITSLENLQGLNSKDLAEIHKLVSPETLSTCAKQLARMSKELKGYQGKYEIGTMTEVGMITRVKTNREKQIVQVQVSTGKGSQLLTIEELEEAISKTPMIKAIKGYA